MRSLSILLSPMVLSALLLAASGKDPVKGPVKDAPKPAAEPRYDTATVIDVPATVEEVREVKTAPMKGQHLTVKTEKETLDVYLGPAEFVKIFEVNFAKGDQIRVIGSRVKVDGADVVLAREVRKGEVSLLLREANGEPNWKYWKPLG